MKIKSLQKIITLHISLSLLLITLIYYIIIPTWYPSEFSKILAGTEIFTILISVELGLIITLILLLSIGRNNSKKEVLFIYCLFFSLQASAAIVGIKTLYEAKPMYIAYEFDRFRIVRPIDIIWGNEKRKYNLFRGPTLYSTEKYPSNDIRLLKSIRDSINGIYPSFKKERLIPYENSKIDIIKNSRSLAALSNKKLNKIIELFGKVDINTLAYYPLVSYLSDEWIVIISLHDATIIGYANVDGWES
ncbi:hypothetical protein [Pseudoalteromonas sp. 1CM17D]|uniref:hypothetical protein n=1 Tax=Pseudoalteromonas TaxID=53246 RepID=UPI0020BFC823|nr:hypothetical protein [Pseudoalteromonas sp. 1CM17D]MCK8097134.1 hypothetical protein [Pseudoalteromonas sp. 1CM17D]